MESFALDAEITHTIYQHCAQHHCRWSSRQGGPLSSTQRDSIRAQYCSAIHICTAPLFHLSKQVYGRWWHGVFRNGGDGAGTRARGGKGEDEEPPARVSPGDRHLVCYYHHGCGVFGVRRVRESMKRETFWHRIALKYRAYDVGLECDDTKWRETKVTGSRTKENSCISYRGSFPPRFEYCIFLVHSKTRALIQGSLTALQTPDAHGSRGPHVQIYSSLPHTSHPAASFTLAPSGGSSIKLGTSSCMNPGISPTPCPIPSAPSNSASSPNASNSASNSASSTSSGTS